LTGRRTCVTIEPADSRRIEMVTRVPLRRDVSGERLTQPPPRVRKRAVAVAGFVSAAMLAVVPSAGAGVLDQSQPILGNTAFSVADFQSVAQTFTAGITGGLDQVDLGIGRFSPTVTVPLRVEIRGVASGVPSGPALASADVSAANVPSSSPIGFVSVPLAPPALVMAGVQYAIVLSSSSCGGFPIICYGLVFGFGPGSSYPGGVGMFTRNSGATWTPLATADFSFKTYVGPAPVRPTSKSQCKKGGWRQFSNPSFRNQGQCVKYVNHQGGKSSKGKYNAKGQGKKKTGKKK
jgi:hypothetical protein